MRTKQLPYPLSADEGQIEEDVELPHLRCPGGNEGAEGSDGESRSQHSQQIRPETSTEVRTSATFGARGRRSVRYGTRLGDLKENWFLLFSN
jgi:hypothetical protein